MPVETLKEEITKQLRRVNSSKYAQLLKGINQKGVVNHLLTSTKNGEVCLVSEFVVRSLSLMCEISITNGFLQYKAVQENPAFHGWVVELKFLIDMRLAENKKNR